jgi:uncharacterized protein with GYD domain
MTEETDAVHEDSLYVSLVTVNEEGIQNVQELTSIWGDIRTEVESFDGELVDTYCTLGRYDFLIVFEAPDRGAALQIAVAAERYGLDLETLPVVDVEHLGKMVEEI